MNYEGDEESERRVWMDTFIELLIDSFPVSFRDEHYRDTTGAGQR
jgi:hypothetical protein